MPRNKVITGIAVAVALSVVGLFFVFANNPFGLFESGAAVSQEAQLGVQDTVVGTGAVAEPGDVVQVHYTGRLSNGTVFDTSVGKEPIRFPLGVGYVIPGWEQGLVGMKVGGKRTLTVPPSMGYGAQDYGPIPGGSTLTFDIELVGVEKGAASAAQ